MPLSEHEQRQLEQIEQALYADHPKLAKAMRAKEPRVHYRRRVILAALAFVVGVGVVVAGFVLKHLWLELAGFAVMLAASMWAVSSYRKMARTLVGRGRAHQRRAPRPARTGMMERLEERWRRRQERDR